jgi:RNA-binding protein 39
MLDPLEREQIERDRDDRTVFVTNLPLRAYEDDIEKFFSQAGKVRDIRLITDRNSRKSKG